MSKEPKSLSFETHLPDVYRFAFLMTGETAAAAAVLRRTVEGAVREGIGDLRDTRRVKRWLFTEARRQCARPAAAAAPSAEPVLDDRLAAPTEISTQLAARFAGLPTAERGALILFYLYLFDPADLAEVLEIPPAELPPLLSRGRTLLGEGAPGPDDLTDENAPPP